MSLRIDRNEAIWTVVLDRPGRKNAVDRKHAEQLVEAFRAFDRDETAEVGVLWGTSGTFCAGADLQAAAAGEPNRLEPDGPGPMGPTREFLDKPVVAGIAGHAVAGGLELALWCDLRVVEESAILGVFCRRWGIPLIDGGTVRLPRLIGESHALDLVLTGRRVDADEARRIGLANRVVPEGKAREEAEALARRIAEHPTTCMRSDRRSIYEQSGRPVDEAMDREFELAMETIDETGFEGAHRFVDDE